MPLDLSFFLYCCFDSSALLLWKQTLGCMHAHRLNCILLRMLETLHKNMEANQCHTNHIIGLSKLTFDVSNIQEEQVNYEVGSEGRDTHEGI
ncbi:hypothetical protein CsSME_00011130 [Camellia sinensis var. sinensis]